MLPRKLLIPDSRFPPPISKSGKIVSIHTYRTSTGQPYIFAVQYSDKMLYWCYYKYLTEIAPRWLPSRRPPDGVPLYNLHQITNNPKAEIIICKDEQTADNLSRVSLGACRVITTWPLLSTNYHRVNYTPLQNRIVTIDRDCLLSRGQLRVMSRSGVAIDVDK